MDWLHLQLADSAFPTGGFAHSAGLEAAVQLGRVKDEATLRRFAEDALHQCGHGALPFVRAAHEGPAELADIDQLADAFLSSHVANRASRTQGRALVATAAKIFPEPAVQALYDAVKRGALAGHQAPLFGATLRALDAELQATQAIFLHLSLRAVVSAAVRLGVVGPHAGQRLQRALSPLLDDVLARAAALTLDDVAQPAPLLELCQTLQDRLYARLFQS